MRGIESGIVYTRFLTRRIDHVPGHAWPDTSGSSFASSTAVMQVGCTSARMIYEVFHTVSAMSNLPALLRALKKTLRSVSDPSLSLHSIVSSRPFHWTSLYIRLYWKNECIDGARDGSRKETKERKGKFGEKNPGFYRSSRRRRKKEEERMKRRGEKEEEEKEGKSDELQSIHRIIQISSSKKNFSLSLSLSRGME